MWPATSTNIQIPLAAVLHAYLHNAVTLTSRDLPPDWWPRSSTRRRCRIRWGLSRLADWPTG